MSWLIVRSASAYALPLAVVVAAMGWWRPGETANATAMIVVVASMAAWQGLLLRESVRWARRAHIDPLTQLPNRAFAVERLRVALAVDRTVGLVFLDLDGFKDVNDSFGHLVGDRVLAEVARRLELTAGPEAFVARYGGDEFAILVSAGELETSRLARRIETCLRRTAAVPGSGSPAPVQEVRLSASVGVAVSTGGDADDLLAAADAAMYLAKRAPTGIRTTVPNRETIITPP